MSKYRDKRETFFTQSFQNSLPYEEYVTGSKYEAKWRGVETEIDKLTLPEVVKSFRRKVYVLLLSGIWCGDCQRQGPMLRKIEQNFALMELRFAESSQLSDLAEELRINGAEKVPVVVTLNEDFHEVSRFGDRHLSVYRSKVEKEVGAQCDPGILPPEKSAIQEELEEWVSHFERIQHLLRLAPALRARHGD